MLRVALLNPGGQLLEVLVQPDAKVLDLKLNVFQRLKIPFQCQKYIIDTQVLLDGDMLSSHCTVTPNGSTISLTMIVMVPTCCAQSQVSSEQRTRMIAFPPEEKEENITNGSDSETFGSYGSHEDDFEDSEEVENSDEDLDYDGLEEDNFSIVKYFTRRPYSRNNTLLPNICPTCDSLLVCVGKDDAPSLKLSVPAMPHLVSHIKKALRFIRIVEPAGLCLHRVDGRSVRQLTLKITSKYPGDYGISAFTDIAVLFPAIEEFHFDGDWSMPGACYDLRGLCEWQKSLRVLDLSLVSGIENPQVWGPGVLTCLQNLQELRLGYFRDTPMKDIAALGKLQQLKSFVFWGDTDDHDDLNSDFDSSAEDNEDHVLDMTLFSSLQLVALRGLDFCDAEEQKTMCCMALRLPHTLNQLVIVSESPRAGLTSKLRRHLLAKHQIAHFDEYVTASQQMMKAQRSMSQSRTRVLSKASGTLLWELRGDFKVCSPAEMESIKESRLRAEVSRLANLLEPREDMLATWGVRPSTDGPFKKGETVWMFTGHDGPNPEESVVEGVPIRLLSESDDEFEYKQYTNQYLVFPKFSSPRHRVYRMVPPQHLFRSSPLIIGDARSDNVMHSRLPAQRRSDPSLSGQNDRRRFQHIPSMGRKNCK